MENFESKIKKRLVEFNDEFESVCRQVGRDPKTVNILFATKYLKSEELASFIELYYQLRGEKLLIGENKVQDFVQKSEFLDKNRKDLSGSYYRVMIGNLQKNKINKALNLFDEIWGVDSRELVREINKRVHSNNFSEKIYKSEKLPIFLEINISGEETKHGVSLKDLDEVIEEVQGLENLRLKGLMTMAPVTNDRNFIKEIFRTLKKVSVSHKILASMGMSGDWKEAIEEGSDYLRIGSLIFN